MDSSTKYLIKTEAVHNELLCRTNENKEYLKNLFYKYISPIAEIESIQITEKEISAIINVKSSEEIRCAKRNLNLTKNYMKKSTSFVISNQFKCLFNSYAHSYNKMYDRYGRLYASTFKRHILLE